jgi:hypothetical protein
MFKHKLLINHLIQENTQNFLESQIDDITYSIRNSIFESVMSLFEDENDSFLKRHGGKLAVAGGLGVLANGGTFGAGAQNIMQSGLSTVKNVSHSAFDKASEGLNKSANYYSHGLSKEDPNSLVGASLNSHAGTKNNIIGYDSDGHMITAENANKFSKDGLEVLKDKAHDAIDNNGDDIVGGAVGAGLGALAGGAFGKKTKNVGLGAGLGAGLGGLAGALV